MKVYPYGEIDIGTEATGTFKVSGSRLKHYLRYSISLYWDEQTTL